MRIAVNLINHCLFGILPFKIKKATRMAIILTSVCVLTGCKARDQALSAHVSDVSRDPLIFDGERAYESVTKQVGFGPRIPGSVAHERTMVWLEEELNALGWKVEVQPFIYGGFELKNIIARSRSYLHDEAPIIIGAHFDSRLYADRDPDLPNQPVPGANDGASGVAVLLELARVLDRHSLQNPVWLVFFDAEDNGRINGWDWILGSRFFVDHLDTTPLAAVIVDMVGDADLQLYYEKNSDEVLRERIWETGASLGYGEFILEEKHSILDDHTPFLQAGIPAVDIIDFDYAYFHTTADLPDKVSAESLEVVGRTLEVWLEGPH